MPSMTIGLDLETITCCRDGCGIVFAVPGAWKAFRREDHKDFYCPNGHCQNYPHQTEAERLGKELAAKKAYAERLEAQAVNLVRQKEAAEKALTRHKKRTANGVCPCCHRSFQNLRRHMQTKHPESVEKANA